MRNLLFMNLFNERSNSEGKLISAFQTVAKVATLK